MGRNFSSILAAHVQSERKLAMKMKTQMKSSFPFCVGCQKHFHCKNTTQFDESVEFLEQMRQIGLLNKKKHTVEVGKSCCETDLQLPPFTSVPVYNVNRNLFVNPLSFDFYRSSYNHVYTKKGLFRTRIEKYVDLNGYCISEWYKEQVNVNLFSELPFEMQVLDGMRRLTGETAAAIAITTSAAEEVHRIATSMPPDLGVKIEAIASNVETITRTLSSYLTGVDSALKDVITNMLVFVYDLFMAIKYAAWYSLPTLGLRFATILGIAGSDIYRWLVKMMTGDKEQMPPHGNEMQGFEIFKIEDISFATLLVGLIGATITRKLPDYKTVSAINAYCRMAECVPKSMKSITNLGVKFLEAMPACINQWVYSICPETWFLDINETSTKFYEWATRVRDRNTLDNNNRLMWDTVLQFDIINDYKLGCDFLKEAAVGTVVNSKMYTYINNSFKISDEMFRAVELSQSTAGLRREPFTIVLAGEPGKGKSHIASTIPLVLAPEGMDRRNVMYSRNTGEKFWSGYNGQFATMIDDFGQAMSPDINEALDLIYMKSPLQYRLQMADLKEKGRTFTSRVVVMTTNSPYVEFAGVRSSDAVDRRKDVLVRVSVDDMYIDPNTGTVDPTLVPADNSHYIIEFLDPNNNREGHNIIAKDGRLAHSFEQFMCIVYQEYLIQANKAEISYARRLGDVDDLREIVRNRAAFDLVRHPLEKEAELFAYDPSLERAVTRQVIVERAQFEMQGLSDIGKFFGFIPRDDEEQEEVFVDAHTHQEYVAAIAAADRHTQEQRERDIAELKKNIKENFVSFMSKFNAFGLWLLEWKGIWMPLVLMGISGASGWFKSKRSEKIVGMESGETRTANIRKVVVKAQAFDMQGSSDPNADAIAQVMAKYMFVITSPYAIMQAFGVCGTVLLVPLHFFYDRKAEPLKRGEILWVYTPEGVRYAFPYEPNDAVQLGDHDAVLLDTRNAMRSVRNNVKHFITEKDLTYANGFPAEMLGNIYGVVDDPDEDERSTIKMYGSSFKLVRSTTRVGPVMYEGKYDPEKKENLLKFVLQNGWEYDASTSKGECGAVLIAHNTHLQHKLIGIHIGGSKVDTKGLADLVTQEMLNAGLREFPNNVIGTPMFDMQVSDDLDKAKVLPDGNFSYVGVVASNESVRLPSKTDIEPSLVHGVFPIITAPSVLSAKDPRNKSGISPLVKGISKFGEPNLPFDIETLTIAADGIIEELKSHKWDGPRRVLTVDEAINGLPIAYFEPIVMNTSPGYPYVLEKPVGGKGREWMFDRVDDKYVITYDKLKERIEERLQALQKGERVPSIWTECLKDERRPIEKVEQGKTRTFDIAPLDYLIVFRMYFLAFAAFMYSINNKCFSAVGIDPYSYDYTQMYNDLLQVGDLGFGGDHQTFDGKIQSLVGWMIIYIVNMWYNDSHEKERHVLGAELIHTLILVLNFLYYKHQGNPSGCPITSIFNTLANLLYIVYVYLKLAPVSMRTYAHFAKFVRVRIYGDDFIVTVDPEIHSWFNMCTFSYELRKYGIIVTMPDKKSAIVPLTPISELSFLKTLPRRVGRYYLAMMEWDVICEMCSWVRTSPDTREATETNVNMALRFAYFYGKARFEYLRNRVLWFANERNVQLRLLTFDHFYYQIGIPSDEQGFRQGAIQLYQDTSLRALEPVSGTNWRVGSKENIKERVVERDATAGIRGNLDNMDSQQARPVNPQGFEGGDHHKNHGNAMAQQMMSKIMEINPFEMQMMEPDEGALGVSFVNENTVPAQSSGPQAPVSAGAIADINWSAADMVRKPAQVAQLNWTTTQATGAVLQSFYVPGDTIITVPWQQMFNSFTYFRGDVKFHVQVNGTPYHVGKLGMCYVPASVPLDIALQWQVPNFNINSMLEGTTYIDAGSSDPVDMYCPWGYPKSYMLTNDLHYTGTPNRHSFFGTFHIFVFNPLQVVTGTTSSLSVTVWASIENAQFHIPQTTVGPFPSVNRIDINHVKKTGREKKKEVRHVMQGKTGKKGKGGGMFDGILSSIQPDEIAKLAFDILPYAMDFPAEQGDPDKCIRKATSTMAGVRGVATAERLCMYPGNMTKTTPSYFGRPQEEYRDIIKRPSFLTSFTWTTSQAVNTIAYAVPIGPMAPTAEITTPITSTAWAGAPVSLTGIDYFALPFAFWRGDIKFKITISASKFASGRLLVGPRYGVSAAPTNLDQVREQYAMILDLQGGQREWEYVVPYESWRGWSRVNHGTCVTGPTTDPGGLFAPLNFLDCFTGYWVIGVQNNLAVNSLVPPNAVVNIFMSAGDNFELAQPCNHNRTIMPYLPAGVSYQMEGADKADESVSKPALIDVAPPAVLAPTSGLRESGSMYEIFQSISDVCKRSTPMYRASMYLDGTGVSAGWSSPAGGTLDLLTIDTGYQFMVRPPLNIRTSSPTYVSNDGLFGHFAIMFGAWRGSLRYKVLAPAVGFLSNGGVLTKTASDFDSKYSVWHEVTNRSSTGPMNPTTYNTSSTTPNLNTYYASALLTDLVDGYVRNSNTIIGGGNRAAMQWADMRVPFLDVEVPYANENLFLFNSWYYGSDIHINTMDSNGALIVKATMPATALYPFSGGVAPVAQMNFDMFVSAGDDFTMGFFIGIPPMATVLKPGVYNSGTTLHYAAWGLDDYPSSIAMNKTQTKIRKVKVREPSSSIEVVSEGEMQCLDTELQQFWLEQKRRAKAYITEEALEARIMFGNDPTVDVLKRDFCPVCHQPVYLYADEKKYIWENHRRTQEHLVPPSPYVMQGLDDPVVWTEEMRPAQSKILLKSPRAMKFIEGKSVQALMSDNIAQEAMNMLQYINMHVRDPDVVVFNALNQQFGKVFKYEFTEGLQYGVAPNIRHRITIRVHMFDFEAVELEGIDAKLKDARNHAAQKAMTEVKEFLLDLQRFWRGATDKRIDEFTNEQDNSDLFALQRSVRKRDAVATQPCEPKHPIVTQIPYVEVYTEDEIKAEIAKSKPVMKVRDHSNTFKQHFISSQYDGRFEFTSCIREDDKIFTKIIERIHFLENPIMPSIFKMTCYKALKDVMKKMVPQDRQLQMRAHIAQLPYEKLLGVGPPRCPHMYGRGFSCAEAALFQAWDGSWVWICETKVTSFNGVVSIFPDFMFNADFRLDILSRYLYEVFVDMVDKKLCWMQTEDATVNEVIKKEMLYMNSADEMRKRIQYLQGPVDPRDKGNVFF